jgi:signal transduction histidine kinase
MRLMMTGYADLDAVVAAINTGHVFRYIAKPWHENEMASILRQAVEHYELVAERNRLVDQLRASNDRLREADRLKNKFIEVASHELNTPVTIVLGLAELWRIMEGPNATVQERLWLDRIYSAGKRLAGTIEKMFTLIKTDQLVHTLDPVETDVAQLIRRVAGDHQPFLSARRQTTQVETEPDLGTAELDPAKIADALANLLVNAIKFTPDEGVITVRARARGTDEVEIEVVDRGVGIADDDSRHLFQPFFTGLDTMHHSSGDFQFGKRGIGLGLCVVKTFVELHGGRVEARSKPGDGSTFRVTLPRTRPADPGESSI